MTTSTLSTLSNRQQKYVDAIVATHGGTQATYTRSELRTVSEAHGWKWIPNWITHDQARRSGRGVFHIPEAQSTPPDSTESMETTEMDPITMGAPVEPIPAEEDPVTMS